MKARFKAITAALALVALVGVAAQAGEQGPATDNGLRPAASQGVAAPPGDAIPIAHREPRLLRAANADVRSVEPVIRLARAEDPSMTGYTSASRRASPADDPARDPGSGKWAMLLAGLLCAAAIARRRMSS